VRTCATVLVLLLSCVATKSLLVALAALDRFSRKKRRA